MNTSIEKEEKEEISEDDRKQSNILRSFTNKGNDLALSGIYDLTVDNGYKVDKYVID